MSTQTEHTYSSAFIVLNDLLLSREIKVSTRRELFSLYANAFKVIYHRNRTSKHCKKMIASQKKLNNLIDIGEFASKLDANL